MEGSSDFADDSFSSDEDVGEPEATKNESEDNVEPDEDPNKGWADAMAKILNKKIPDKAGTILVKSKALEKEKARERLEKLEKRKEVSSELGGWTLWDKDKLTHLAMLSCKVKVIFIQYFID